MMSAADLPAAASTPAAEHTHGPWVVPTPESPLVCESCGVPWPGEPLPEPAHPRAGYDGVDQGPGFNARLRAALSEVDS